MKRKFGFGLLIVVMLVFTQLSSALADNRRDEDLKVNPAKYRAWGDQFWQYVYTQPTLEDFQQLFAASGECVHTNQNFEVFFLAGVGGGAKRTCEIPAGTRLFFPLIDYSFGEDPIYYDNTAVPPYGPKAFVSWFDQSLSRANGTTVFASLDDEDLVTSKNQRQYLVESNPNKLPTYPYSGFLFGDGKPRLWEVVNGGYYLSLKLPPGKYKLRFGGNIPNVLTFTTTFGPNSLWVKNSYDQNPYVVPLGGFSIDVTYEITVKK